MRFEVPNPKEVVEEAFWLAYLGCGGPVGMGVFQDRDGITKEMVIENVKTAGDYPGTAHNEEGLMYGDYVFGRMMKLCLRFDATGINLPRSEPTPSYQSWCHTYPTYQELILAAIHRLEKTGEEGQ